MANPNPICERYEFPKKNPKICFFPSCQFILWHEMIWFVMMTCLVMDTKMFESPFFNNNVLSIHCNLIWLLIRWKMDWMKKYIQMLDDRPPKWMRSFRKKSKNWTLQKTIWHLLSLDLGPNLTIFLWTYFLIV